MAAGNFQWSWWGDAINTLDEDPNSNTTPLWIPNDVSPTTNTTFVEGDLPSWGTTMKNCMLQTVCPFLF